MLCCRTAAYVGWIKQHWHQNPRIIDNMIKEIPVEGASAAEKKQMDTVMR